MQKQVRNRAESPVFSDPDGHVNYILEMAEQGKSGESIVGALEMFVHFLEYYVPADQISEMREAVRELRREMDEGGALYGPLRGVRPLGIETMNELADRLEQRAAEAKG